jgi:hypothetical protein
MMKRRRLFKLLVVFTLLSMVLIACGTAATPEKIIETVIVEKEGEKIVETVIVEKKVEVVKEIEVEKEVVVTATPGSEEAAAEEAPAAESGTRKIGFLAGVQDPFYFTMQRGANPAPDPGMSAQVFQ